MKGHKHGKLKYARRLHLYSVENEGTALPGLATRGSSCASLGWAMLAGHCISSTQLWRRPWQSLQEPRPAMRCFTRGGELGQKPARPSSSWRASSGGASVGACTPGFSYIHCLPCYYHSMLHTRDWLLLCCFPARRLGRETMLSHR